MELMIWSYEWYGTEEKVNGVIEERVSMVTLDGFYKELFYKSNIESDIFVSSRGNQYSLCKVLGVT